MEKKAYDNVHFLTYSNTVFPFRDNAESYCKSALSVGFKTAKNYTEADLQKTKFWKKNEGILKQPRGGGYWLWKPYIILETLKTLPESDLLFYRDAGSHAPGSFVEFPCMPDILCNLVVRTPQKFVHGFDPGWLRQSVYTKPDCFELMDAYTDEMLHAPMIAATTGIYMRSEACLTFLETWLSYACDPRIITDMEKTTSVDTHWDFEDHRHDQSIASILIHRLKGHYFDFSQEETKAHLKEIKKVNRDIPRLNAQIGYIEEVARLVAPDLDWRNPPPDPMSVYHKLIANFSQDEPIRQMERVPSQDWLSSQYFEFQNTSPEDLTWEMVSSVLKTSPLMNFKLFALLKVSDDTTLFQQAIFSDHIEELMKVHKTEDRTLSKSTTLQMMQNSFLRTEELYPKMARAMYHRIAWLCASQELRDLWIGRFSSIKLEQGKMSMDKFLDEFLPKSEISKYTQGKNALQKFRNDMSASLEEFILRKIAKTQ